MSDGLDLAAIRARAEAPQCRDSSGSRPLRCGDLDLHGSFHCPECRTAKDVLALVDELETLRAKVAAVEALHRPIYSPMVRGDICPNCDSGPVPCETYRAAGGMS